MPVKDFFVRYYVGHTGKFGHEFLQFEFRPDGKFRYANNSHYKNEQIIRKECYVSDAILEEVRRIIEDSEIVKEDDTNWPEPDVHGKQEIEIVNGEDHICFRASKIGSMVDISSSKDPEGLRVLYYLVQDLKCLVFALTSLHFKNEEDGIELNLGHIPLSEVISVHPNLKSDGYAFQINTPSRTYHLSALNQIELDYWITGLVRYIKASGVEERMDKERVAADPANLLSFSKPQGFEHVAAWDGNKVVASEESKEKHPEMMVNEIEILNSDGSESKKIVIPSVAAPKPPESPPNTPENDIPNFPPPRPPQDEPTPLSEAPLSPTMAHKPLPKPPGGLKPLPKPPGA